MSPTATAQPVKIRKEVLRRLRQFPTEGSAELFREVIYATHSDHPAVQRVVFDLLGNGELVMNSEFFLVPTGVR